MSGPSTVSAVVLNYNGCKLLEAILSSLSAQTYPPTEMIVVDNGSRDGSRDYLAERWPAVKVVVIPDNIGVAAALNRGVAAGSGEYVALLNNDIELAPTWLAELVRAFERHPEAGSMACKLRNYYRREELDGAGDVLSRGGAGTKRGHGECDSGQYDQEEEVLAPTGGAGLYRACVLAEVGPFDESFYAYFEDVDWGLRALSAGYRSWYVPMAIGYHMEGRTTGGTHSPTYHALQWRNTIGVIVKNLPLRCIAADAQWILRHQLAGAIASARAGMLLSHLRGLTQALSSLPGWLRERRRIGAARRLSVREFGSAIAAGRRDA